jgi:allantoinase
VNPYNERNIHPATRMDQDYYPYSPFNTRPPMLWPNGARVALMVVINVEFQDLIVPEEIWRPNGTPISLDVRGWSLRDYGARVGVFRLMNILDELGIPATMPINDIVLTRAEAVVEHALARKWELVGHGAKANHYVTERLTEEAELAYLSASHDAIKAATGVAPRGWHGPTQSESTRTPALAAKAGYDYVFDWSNDDQPYEMAVPTGRITSVPYSADTSDFSVITTSNQTPWEYGQLLRDHFDAIYAEGEKTGLTMTVGLSASVAGQPFRSKYIAEFLRYASTKAGVWFTTAGEVADAATLIPAV